VFAITVLVTWTSAVRFVGNPSGTSTASQTSPTMQKIIELLKRQEGLRLHPYPDGEDLSIGYGRNLSSVGITEEEAEQLLFNDLERVLAEVRDRYEYFDGLSENRQVAVLSLAYNLGATRHAQFLNHHAKMAAELYTEAAQEIYPDSRYAQQVPNRARELAEIIASDTLEL